MEMLDTKKDTNTWDGIKFQDKIVSTLKGAISKGTYPNVILLVDNEDPIDLWREQGHLIADKFLQEFGNNYEPNDITKNMFFILSFNFQGKLFSFQSF